MSYEPLAEWEWTCGAITALATRRTARAWIDFSACEPYDEKEAEFYDTGREIRVSEMEKKK